MKRKLVALSLILVLLTAYIGICASKSLLKIGCSTFEAEMSTSTYIAISKTLSKNFFEDLFTIEKDYEGNIVMISANGLKMNLLTKTLAEECLKSYSKVAAGGVNVPLGAFTGISILSGLGRDVKIKMVSVKSVKCRFVSKFESAGINQTKQSLYLLVIPDCNVIAGFKTQKLKTEMEFLCYENYILGKVPETYVNVSDYSEKN